MIFSLILGAISLGLPFWWFRYTCRLILSAKSTRDYTREVAEVNELRFLDVQRDLGHARERRHLDSLEQKLELDYDLVSYLFRHGPAFLAVDDRVEERMLMLNFKLMKTYYALICQVSLSNARQALHEMAQVVGYFANKMGERAACAAPVA